MNKFILLLAVLTSLILSGCNMLPPEDTQDNSQNDSLQGALGDALAGALEEDSSQGTEYTVVNEGRFNFSVPTDYTSSDIANVFMSSDGTLFMGINAVSSIGSEEPDSVYLSILDLYKDSGTITDSAAELKDFVSIDGTECRYGYAKIAMNDTSYSYIGIIVAPNKNLLISIMAQSLSEDDLSSDIMDQLRDSIEFTVSTGDELTGNTIVNANDGSELVLNSDGTYNYYQTESAHDDNYYSGSYEVYYGNDAFEKLVSMTEYGYTEDELTAALKNGMNGYTLMSDNSRLTFDDEGNIAAAEAGSHHISLDSFHLLILTHKASVIGGVEEPLDNVAVPFLGYYMPELSGFDSLNLNTVTSQFWEMR